MRQRKIDSERLKRMYARNRSSRVLFHQLGRHQRSHGNSTSLEELLAGMLSDQNVAMSRRELVRLLRALAEAGCGRFRIGRHGQRSRFEWTAPAQSIAASVIGEISAPSANGASQTAQTTTGTDLIHTYHLRRQLTVSISLPADLTDREAERLADFIRTLSFGSAASPPATSALHHAGADGR